LVLNSWKLLVVAATPRRRARHLLRGVALVFAQSSKLLVIAAAMLSSWSAFGQATQHSQAPYEHLTRKVATKAKPDCPDPKKPLCHLELGQEYLAVGLWSEGQKECSIVLGNLELAKDAEECVRTVTAKLDEQRSSRVKGAGWVGQQPDRSEVSRYGEKGAG
jgi:hypothetical protein